MAFHEEMRDLARPSQCLLITGLGVMRLVRGTCAHLWSSLHNTTRHILSELVRFPWEYQGGRALPTAAQPFVPMGTCARLSCACDSTNNGRACPAKLQRTGFVKNHLVLLKIESEDLRFKQSGLGMRDVSFCCSNGTLNSFPLCRIAINLSPACFLDCSMSLPLQAVLWSAY